MEHAIYLIDFDDVGKKWQCFNLSSNEIHKHFLVESRVWPETSSEYYDSTLEYYFN